MARKKRQIGEPAEPRRRPILPGRQTRPTWSTTFGMLPYNYIPRRRYEQYDLSKFEHSYLTVSQFLSILPDLNADIGLAVWNVLRLASEGFDYTVKDSTGQDDEAGVELLDNLVGRINERGGGIGNLTIQWLMSGFLHGAVAGEVALTEDLRDVDDFIVVDPFTIRFNRDENSKLVAWHYPPTGLYGPGGQVSSGLPVAMNPEKFWYVPIDPVIDDPYGRPVIAPVLQEVWFDISVITDLRKVVHNQGWPRIDIKVLEETLLANAPASVKGDPQGLREWLNERLSDIQEAYNDLQPDDSFVHFDSVEIQQAASISTGKLFDATEVMRCIERRMIKALKQVPILMASNEGTTETHGTVQWQIYVSGLRSLQAPICFMLSRMMELALSVWGRQGRVECWFEPIRTTDRLADANAEKVEIENALMKWRAGWQTWQESSIEITGSAPPEGTEAPDPASFAAPGQLSAAVGQVRTGDPHDERLDDELQAWLDEEDG